ncbi:sensor histidine kinase [Schinkia azotoformans]|uniref:sensor histidine kinase n=1 Tax=Schinkia azotoformans TaxID=1454 RepID=UPI002DBECD7B|nr:sensor histidine kinase [Schinkia azotoformans]MEC1778070.1 sensor histidine kinase [Schinkia azotoformans]MED4328130.1 sensor histidine kinase [Schinkia azotoformans]
MKKFSNIIYKYLQPILPKTFRSHILLSFLFLSFIPLLLIGLYTYHSVQRVVINTSSDIQEEMINDIIRLHQSHLNTQAGLIQYKIDEAKKQVLMGRKMAEDIFQYQSSYPSISDLHPIKEKEGYSWTSPALDQSNIIISARTEVTPKLLDDLSRTAYLEPFFKETVTSTPHMAAMYLILSNSASRIYPALDFSKEIKQGYLKPDIDFTKQTFYQIAVDNIHNHSPTVSISDVYQDITHREQVFTLSTPIIVNGEKIGIIGVDITIPSVLNHILNFKFREKDAYAVLMNDNLTFIANQDEVMDDLNYFTFDYRKKLYNSTKPFSSIINNEEKYLLLSSIKDTSWKLIYVIPKREIISAVKEITNEHIDENRNQFIGQFISIVAVIILIIMMLSFRLWRYATNPLQNLLLGIHALTAGKLNTTIMVDNLKEFKAVSQAFNQMSAALDHLMSDYIKLNNQLENKVIERTKQLESANRTLSETNLLLQSIDETRVELFSNISHDLKTPITICMGYIEAINDGLIPEEKIDVYLSKIYRHLNSIQHLSKGLYELSTIESKRSSYNFQKVNPTEYFRHLLNHYDGKENNLYVMVADGLSTVMADPEYLKRAIYNLIDNAVKYSSNIDLPIEIRVFEEDHSLLFEIKDYGVGITETELPFIFQRFYRIDKSRNSTIPGNGLGLPIVKEIVNEHKGTITVTSTPGKGSIFTIRIPLDQKSVETT